MFSLPLIVVSFMKKSLDSAFAVVFPASVEDLQGSLNVNYIPAQVELPAKLFQKRQANSSEEIRLCVITIFLS